MLRIVYSVSQLNKQHLPSWEREKSGRVVVHSKSFVSQKLIQALISVIYSIGKRGNLYGSLLLDLVKIKISDFQAIWLKFLYTEALAKPQVSPGAIHVQPLRG